jgi:hypothetical protein
VVYFHDGQNVFDPGGPFGSWSADKVAEPEMRAGRVRLAILVAIDNTPDRVREYLPPPDVVPEGRPAAGEMGRAELYARYLLEVVKPWVDRSYRTLPGKEDTLAAMVSAGHPGRAQQESLEREISGGTEVSNPAGDRKDELGGATATKPGEGGTEKQKGASGGFGNDIGSKN